MIFQKKRFLLTVAAMFTTGAMLIGCTGDEPSKPIIPIDPIDPTEGVSLLIPEFGEAWTVLEGGKNVSGGDGFIDNKTFVGNEYIMWEARYDAQPDWTEPRWNHAAVAFWFEPGLLTSNSKFRITYESDQTLQLDLGMKQVFAILPASGGANKPKTVTLDLSKIGGNWETEAQMYGETDVMGGNHFRGSMTSWGGTPNPTIDLSTVGSIDFNTAARSGTAMTNWVKITTIKLIDGNWGDDE